MHRDISCMFIQLPDLFIKVSCKHYDFNEIRNKNAFCGNELNF